MTSSILSLPTDEELSDETLEALSAVPPLNVFRMVALAPASLSAFSDLARSILIGSELDAKAREIAVLRVAHLTRSSYVWTQHVALSKMLGIPDETIERIGVDGPVEGLGDEATLICRVADEITRDVRLSDEALTDVVNWYGRRQAAELIFCVSYFNLVTRFVESTRVPLEPPGGLLR